VDAVAVYSDGDAAALYDLLNPWDPARYPSDAVYHDLVMAPTPSWTWAVGFETRHPQARAWEDRTPSNGSEVVDVAGRRLRVWHQVEQVVGDVVTFIETTSDTNGTVLRVDRASLRFLDVPTLGAFLAGAGFVIEAQYGDWHRGPITDVSREIVTIARRI
jgi:hypothetical protein